MAREKKRVKDATDHTSRARARALAGAADDDIAVRPGYGSCSLSTRERAGKGSACAGGGEGTKAANNEKQITHPDIPLRPWATRVKLGWNVAAGY
jgi:hypothetical protein